MSETLIGKYRLLAELGRGGMADVYLAASSGMGGFQKLVVIKVSRVSDDPAFSQMFLDEARLSARLSHSNIVQTYEVGEENGRQFIVMEYLDGPSLFRLNRLAAPNGGVPLRMVVQVLSNVLAGLHYAHSLKDFDGSSLNVVHRDVSPQNVMVTTQGECKLLDFGIAKTTDSRTMTHAGFYRGKLNYMAPEQALGNPVDARADVFSVGVLLAEAITRKPFWDGATPAVVSAKLVNGEIPDIEQAGIEPLLEEICKGALNPNRDQRTASAREFKESLDWYLGTMGGPVSAEELAAFIAPLVAPDRQRVNALIDQQLRQGAAPVPVNMPLPQASRGSGISAYAALTNSPVTPMGSPGSGYTPVSSSSAISVPAQRSPVLSATDSVLQPVGSAEAPTSIARPSIDRGVRTATRKPADSPQGSNLKVIIGAVAAGFVVLVGLVVWLATRQSPAPVAASAPAPTEPVRATAPAFVPREGKIEILIEPASASLELDGQAVANPFEATQLDGRTHHLSARADGYESHSRDLVFDRDLTVSFALRPQRVEPVREAPVAPAPAKVAPPAPPPTAKRPPPRPVGKTGAAAAKEDAANDQSVIQELQPKQAKPAAPKRNIDTEVFDDKKQEIDRNSPWEN